MGGGWEVEVVVRTHTIASEFMSATNTLHPPLSQLRQPDPVLSIGTPPPRGGFLFTVFPDQEPGG